nr:iron ABC transporter permease [uncultured Flavonifractor sp.]
MRRGTKVLLVIGAAILILMASIAVGSVNLSLGQVVEILLSRLTGETGGTDANLSAIVWGMRFPRAVLAFLAGAALSASGTVMQSVLKNPLASSYTLGVSSGASLCAALVMVTGFTIPVLGTLFTLPAAGFAGGLATVFLALAFASRLDGKMENQTVILVGMVFSLFVNAILTLLTSLSREHLQQMVFWQMGGFTGRDWSHVAVMFPVLVVSLLVLQWFSPEMDIMSFGEEQAMSMGVDLKRVKLILIGIAALLTGTAVSLVGVIGFVDLIAPHVVRRLFGSSHRLVLPMSALFGGGFLMLAELISRTVMAPTLIPVGAVTALVGAPFFALVFFRGRKLK